MSTTTITITDPKLLAQIAAADGQIVFRGPAGEHVKTTTVDDGAKPPGGKSPFTNEQIEEARKQTGGSSLTEVWKRIHERYGA